MIKDSLIGKKEIKPIIRGKEEFTTSCDGSNKEMKKSDLKINIWLES